MAERGNHEILLETGTNEIEIMEFTIDGNLYGINVAKVREILPEWEQTEQRQQQTHDRGMGGMSL